MRFAARKKFRTGASMFTMAARGIKPVAVTFLKFGFNNCSEVQVFRLHALHQYLLRLAVVDAIRSDSVTIGCLFGSSLVLVFENKDAMSDQISPPDLFYSGLMAGVHTLRTNPLLLFPVICRELNQIAFRGFLEFNRVNSRRDSH